MKGFGGSNPPLSAIQSVLLSYKQEIAENRRVRRRLSARCDREKASLARDRANFPGLYPPAENSVRFPVSGIARYQGYPLKDSLERRIWDFIARAGQA